MYTYEKPLDPSETKDYTYDWTNDLGDGEAITSQTVTFVDANGASSPADSFSGNVSRVFLAGGTHGGTIIYLVTVSTDAGNDLELAFAVNVIDNAIGETAETEAETLARYIAEAKAQRQKVALGNAVIDVWRDGRRMRMEVTSIDNLNAYIREMERELAALTAAAAGRPRRRAIGTYF